MEAVLLDETLELRLLALRALHGLLGAVALAHPRDRGPARVGSVLHARVCLRGFGQHDHRLHRPGVHGRPAKGAREARDALLVELAASEASPVVASGLRLTRRVDVSISILPAQLILNSIYIPKILKFRHFASMANHAAFLKLIVNL